MMMMDRWVGEVTHFIVSCSSNQPSISVLTMMPYNCIEWRDVSSHLVITSKSRLIQSVSLQKPNLSVRAIFLSIESS
jgi:hypothetical protein